MKINRFITFEGIDGSGKTTQIKLLKRRLELNNQKVMVLREPGGTELTESLRNIILDKSLKISNKSEMLLFLAARADLVNEVIRPVLGKDHFVVCDRYVDSTLAYQGYGRDIDLDIINDLNEFVTSSLLPSVTFFLDINIKTMYHRRKNMNDDRMEKSGSKFFEKVRKGYLNLDKNNDRFVKIDASDSIESIHESIWNYVKVMFKDDIK